MISRDGDRARLFSRRALLLGGTQAVLTSALIGRMYYLQVVEAEKYKVLAEENRINMRLLPPPRGRIVDRNGIPMAVNRQNLRALIVPEQTRDIDATLDALSRIIDVTAYERERVKREIRRKRSFVPVLVRENLSWQEMSRIQVNAPDLPGVVIDEGLSRFYPQAENSAHVLGYVSAVSEDDMGDDPLLELPGFRIGKSGVERHFDKFLRGRAGNSQVEVNALGRVIRELSHQEGEPGAEIHLTIDERLQRFASQRMGSNSAACVVMDVHTGELLTLASTPAFDPNAFNRGLSNQEWRTLSTDPRAPMNNKALTGQYSPGSTFKMIVALAGLKHGLINRDTTVTCRGHIDMGRRRFHCWKEEGHGRVDLIESIAQSCDIYFYELARKLGVDRIAEVARSYGLGAKTGYSVAAEKDGLIPTEAWKRATIGEPWHPGENLNVGIGQGYVLSTPLQLAVMTARMANGGTAVRPTLTRQQVSNDDIVTQEADAFPAMDVSHDHLALIRESMYAVVNGKNGTARGSRIRVGGAEMAGKTGTTQVRRITMAEREAGLKSQEELAWRERNHALFVAYAPADKPRYALSVIVEHGGSGAAAAAPIAKDVMAEVLRLYPSNLASAPTTGGRPEEELG